MLKSAVLMGKRFIGKVINGMDSIMAEAFRRLLCPVAKWESLPTSFRRSGKTICLVLMNSPQCKLAILPSRISGTHKETCISEKGCVSLRIREGVGRKGKV